MVAAPVPSPPKLYQEAHQGVSGVACILSLQRGTSPSSLGGQVRANPSCQVSGHKELQGPGGSCSVEPNRTPAASSGGYVVPSGARVPGHTQPEVAGRKAQALPGVSGVTACKVTASAAGSPSMARSLIWGACPFLEDGTLSLQGLITELAPDLSCSPAQQPLGVQRGRHIGSCAVLPEAALLCRDAPAKGTKDRLCSGRSNTLDPHGQDSQSHTWTLHPFQGV